MADEEKEILGEEETTEDTNEDIAEDIAEGSAGEDSADEEKPETAEEEEAETAPGDTGGSEGGEKSEKSEKSGFFKKKDKKEKKDKKDEMIEELSDKVKRQLAEFENFRNRSEREKASMFENGAKSTLEKILPVVDNFERGFLAVESEDSDDAFVKGMEQVYKQLTTTLTDLGVTPIEALGQPFDPALHNAVMQEASEEYESGCVCKELQKGYMYRDSVLRHSMVAVVP